MKPIYDKMREAGLEGWCWHEWVKTDGVTFFDYPKNGQGKPGGMGYECTCGLRKLNREHFHISDGVPNLFPTCVNVDLKTWEGFGKLLEGMKKSPWWEEFCIALYEKRLIYTDPYTVGTCFNVSVINPTTFCDLVAEFLEVEI